jgi:4-amino-4-deoxy-L-arabinose transferase-like glycosyltransferase
MRRGGVATAVVLAYTGTSVVGGFVSGSFYRKLSRGEGSWVWTAVLTLLMFPVPFVIVFILVNSTAWANEVREIVLFCCCSVLCL